MPCERGNQPTRGHFGKKNYFAALPLQFSFPVFLYSSWCGCVFFVMKYVPVGFLNINPRRPMNECNAACRRNSSRSFAIQTWELRPLGNHCHSHSGCPGLGNAGCGKAPPVYKCPVAPGQKAGTWSKKVFPARCSTGRSESYQDKCWWSWLGKYIANCFLSGIGLSLTPAEGSHLAEKCCYFWNRKL